MEPSILASLAETGAAFEAPGSGPTLLLVLAAVSAASTSLLAIRGLRRPAPRRSDDEARLGRDAALHGEREARARAERALAARDRELAAALEAAEAAGRAKVEFLANMSHEIRTPLNAVIGLSENLLATTLTSHQRDQVSTVLEAGEQLLRVVDDILDFSTIEAGTVSFERVAFNLEDAVGDTLRSFVSRASRKGLELTCHIAPNVPRMLRGDCGRLRQVLTHLVANAITYTEAGEVTVRIQREPIERSLFLRFSVEDTGVGIEPERIHELFESFQSGDMSTTRAHGGTGLGLSICRGLVQLLGGHMNAISAVGRGSTFFFTALFEPGPEGAIAAPAGALEGVRILVVDDSATNRSILSDTLGRLGMIVLEADSAEAGLRRLDTAFATGEPVALVLTDLHMPELDGYGFVERIRARAELDPVRVVMLSSGGPCADEARRRGLRIGACLLKPVKEYELLGVISRVLGRPAGLWEEQPVAETLGELVPQVEEPEMALETEARPSPLEILVVEDSVANQKVALAILKQHGHSITLARDGQEAVAVFGSQSFDLVLMDVQMPLMDGYESTRAIRAMEERIGGHVPIVAMTAHALQGDREKCLAAGMDEYLRKPIRREELLRMIAEVSPARCPIVDWSGPLAQVGGERAVLREVVEASIHEIRDHLDSLSEGIEAGDWQGVRRCACGLKSAMLGFGAEAIAELALRLDQHAEAADRDSARRGAEDLERAAGPVVSELIWFVETGWARAE